MEAFKHNPNAGRTAIRRNKMSTPTRMLMNDGSLGEVGKYAILDYGAGKGDDYFRLTELGYNVYAYDPHHEPFKQEPPHYDYNIVLCNYVLNVTRDDKEMEEIMFNAYARLKQGGVAYFTVRRDIKKEGEQRTGAYQRNVHPDKVCKECRLYASGAHFETYIMRRPHV